MVRIMRVHAGVLYLFMVVSGVFGAGDARGGPAQALDDGGRGVSLASAAMNQPARGAMKPMLNMVAVGISAYEDAERSLTFAAKDAEDLSAAMQAQERRAYERVRVHSLIDERATRANLLAELQWLQRESREGDVSIFFMAGHGTADDSDSGRLQLLAVDYRKEQAAATRIQGTELQSQLGAVKGTLLVILDTCYSGDLGWRSRALDQLQSEAESSARRIILFAAAAKGEVARESKSFRNGALTRAAIEAVRGSADYQGRGEVTLSAMEHYIHQRVPALTRWKQSPVIWSPTAMTDFIVSHGRRPLHQRPSFWVGFVTSLVGSAGLTLALTRPWESLPTATLRPGVTIIGR